MDIDNNINNDNADNNSSDTDINSIIINILEDHGYKRIDLLNQLAEIYNSYQAKFMKIFKIHNYTYFTILKDTIWYK